MIVHRASEFIVAGEIALPLGRYPVLLPAPAPRAPDPRRAWYSLGLLAVCLVFWSGVAWAVL